MQCFVPFWSSHSTVHSFVSLCHGVLVVLPSPQSAGQCAEMGAGRSSLDEDSVVYSACQADLTCFHCDSVSMVLQRLRQSGRPSKHWSNVEASAIQNN